MRLSRLFFPFLLVLPLSYRKTLIARLLLHHHFLLYFIFFLYLSKYYHLRAKSIRDSLFCVDTISAHSLFRYILLIFRFYIDLHLAVNYTPDNLIQINFSLVFPQFGFITRLLFTCFVSPWLIIFRRRNVVFLNCTPFVKHSNCSFQFLVYRYIWYDLPKPFGWYTILDINSVHAHTTFW